MRLRPQPIVIDGDARRTENPRPAAGPSRLEQALPMITSGENIDPQTAARIGLIDALVPAEQLLTAARAQRAQAAKKDNAADTHRIFAWAEGQPWARAMAPALQQIAIPERQVMMWTQPLKPDYFRLGAFPVFNFEAPEGRFYGFPVYGIPGFKLGKRHFRVVRMSAAPEV